MNVTARALLICYYESVNILLLGGNSQHNQPWIHQVGDVLAADFNKCVVHDYNHWDDPGGFIDFDLELSRLSAAAVGLEPYAVFAKSAGSVLALKAISRGVLKPTKCIFAGLPIKLAADNGIPLQDLIITSHVPTMYIQNAGDPLGSYAQLVKYLRSIKATQYKTIKLDDNSHNYDDLNQIRSLIHSFVRKTDL